MPQSSISSLTVPGVPVASVAAYAVVQNVRPPGVSVAAVRAHWLQTSLMPSLLVVVTQGAVPGEQNINRAEFCAVIQACQHDLLHLFARFLVALSKQKALLKRHAAGALRREIEATASDPSGQPARKYAEQWFSLQPLPPWKEPLPRWQRDWILAASWPPWFTIPLWEWACTLRWPTPAVVKGDAKGATYIELVANFVAVTKLTPPAGLDDVQVATARGVPDRPRSLRNTSMCFMDAVRQLERIYGQRLLPPRQGKVFGLRRLGQSQPRIGVANRPFFQETQDTCALLLQVLDNGGITPLQGYVREYSHEPPYWPDQAMTGAYDAMSVQSRASLCRWLRRLRRSD